MNRIQSKTISLHSEMIHRGYLSLVNVDNPIIGDFTSTLELDDIGQDILLERRTAIMYGEIIKKICGDGKIIPVSGYRSIAEQELIFASAVTGNGLAFAKTFVALPGCSEHQTGFAIDVARSCENIDYIAPDFSYDGICQRFCEVAFRHGFIQRYPAGKENVTGIGHEPWHFRYVGIPHSLLLKEKDFTLEEYIQWIKRFPFASSPYQFETENQLYFIGNIPVMDSDMVEISMPVTPYTLSGNNVDGFIIAAWGERYGNKTRYGPYMTL